MRVCCRASSTSRCTSSRPRLLPGHPPPPLRSGAIFSLAVASTCPRFSCSSAAIARRSRASTTVSSAASLRSFRRYSPSFSSDRFSSVMSRITLTQLTSEPASSIERHHAVLRGEDLAVLALHLKGGRFAGSPSPGSPASASDPGIARTPFVHVQQPHRLAYHFLAGVSEELGGGGVAIDDAARIGADDQQAVAQTGEGLVQQALGFPQGPARWPRA